MAETDTVVTRTVRARLRAKTVRVHDLSGVGYVTDPDCDEAIALMTVQAAELARLQAENEALRRERDEERDESMWRFWRDKAAALATKCDAEKAAREAAEAKAERLKEALKALADIVVEAWPALANSGPLVDARAALEA